MKLKKNTSSESLIKTKYDITRDAPKRKPNLQLPVHNSVKCTQEQNGKQNNSLNANHKLNNNVLTNNGYGQKMIEIDPKETLTGGSQRRGGVNHATAAKSKKNSALTNGNLIIGCVEVDLFKVAGRSQR